MDSSTAVSFDFQHFLDQIKLRSADPVAKYLKSFLANFSKRTFTLNDQIKIINDFLNILVVLDEVTDEQNSEDAKKTRDTFVKALNSDSEEDVSPVSLFTKE